MRDYGQVLSQKPRQRQPQQFNTGADQGQQQQNPGSGNRRTRFAVANTLGSSAETARGLGISRKQAHRIIDTAYHGGPKA